MLCEMCERHSGEWNIWKDKTIIYVSHKNKKNYFKRVIYV